MGTAPSRTDWNVIVLEPGAPANEVNDLESISLFEHGASPDLPWDDLAISFDGHTIGSEQALFHKARKRRTVVSLQHYSLPVQS